MWVPTTQAATPCGVPVVELLAVEGVKFKSTIDPQNRLERDVTL